MRNERAWPQQCWKSCANGSNIVALRFGDHGTKEMLGVVGWKVWPVACENIRFSSLFADGDVSRETSPAAKSKEKGMFSKAIWPVSNFAQQHATTSNNLCNRVCKRTQHVTSNNVGSCWPIMLRPFARGLKRKTSTSLALKRKGNSSPFSLQKSKERIY